MRQGFLLGLAKLRSLIASIGEEFAQERIQTEQGRENQDPTVAILKVGGMNHRMKQEAYGVDEDVTLLAFDLLARIVAARVDAAPPFSAPLTL
jgi:hypothetical protein